MTATTTTRADRLRIAATGALALVCTDAFAQLEIIEDTGTTIFEGINAASVIIVAVAILIAGLGIAFRVIGWAVAGYIVGGAIIAGSALELAEMFVGG